MKSGSGGDASQVPKWPFFNQLRFLTDTIEPRNMSSSIPEVQEDKCETDTKISEFQLDDTSAPTSSHEQSDFDIASSTRENDGDQLGNTPTAVKTTFKTPSKKKTIRTVHNAEYDDKLLEIEKKKLKLKK